MSTFNLSLFACEKFSADMTPLVNEVDSNHFAALRASAVAASERYSGLPEDEVRRTSSLWIHGGVILSPIEIEAIDSPSPRDIGLWFLQTLDGYLHSTIALPHGWTLARVLRAIAWPQSELQQLFVGTPNSRLLKSDSEENPLEPVVANAPYWLWLRFDGAVTGWLNNLQVGHALELLNRDRQRILDFDFRQLEGISRDDPVVVEHFRKRTESHLDEITHTLQSAQIAGVGVLTSMIYLG